MKTIILTELNRQAIENYLNAVKWDGSMMMEVKKVSSKRSLKQNNLYWMWLGVISKDTGYTSNELHVAFRKKYLQPITIEAFGEKHEELPSTTKLKVGEFTEYLNEIENLVADIGIVLPHPEDLYYEAMGYARKTS